MGCDRKRNPTLDELKRTPASKLLPALGFSLVAKSGTYATWRGHGDKINVRLRQNEPDLWCTVGGERGGTVIDLMLEYGNVRSVGEAISVIRQSFGNGLDLCAPDTPPPVRELFDYAVPDSSRLQFADCDCAQLEWLSDTRGLSESVIDAAIRQGVLRSHLQHGYRNIAFLHYQEEGRLSGAEVRNENYRAAIGTRGFFRFAHCDQSGTVVLTESAIDALSAVEILDQPAIYLSTGGTPSRRQQELFETLVRETATTHVLCAHDADESGEKFAEIFLSIAAGVGVAASRLRPSEKDWNEVLVHSKGLR